MSEQVVLQPPDDDDDMSLEALQATLAAIQKQSNPIKLVSERTCVDILINLQQIHPLHLITCTNGKEFITTQKLNKEIIQEVN